MTSTAGSESFMLKPLSSPRPPAVGEEVRTFHEVSRYLSDFRKNSPHMEESSQDTTKEYSSEGATSAPELTSSPRNSSPPPAYKWAQSLQCLLDDVRGVDLFEQFLKQEGHDTRSLAFWFACRGVKKTDPADKDKLYKLIKVLYDKKVKKITYISSSTKKDIEDKLSSRERVDVNIFDTAQCEVEQHMLKTTYPNFLSSDLYLMHLDSVQGESAMEKEFPLSPDAMNLLPTVHEHSELSFSVIKAQSKEPLLARRRSLMSKVKGESQQSMLLKSPYGSYSGYHTKYASYLPASAVDSELQSLSSDAQTDDTMSQTDSSIDYPMHRTKSKRQQKLRYMGNILNKDRLSNQPFVPRTQRPATENMTKKTPEEFHAILVKKLQKVVEEQKLKDKMNERLKAIEASDNLQQDNVIKYPYKSAIDQRLSIPAGEEDQEILDKHLERVFADTGLTPKTMSPGTASPSVKPLLNEDSIRLALSGHSAPESAVQDMPYNISVQKNGQLPPPYSVPYASRYRRDPDTISSSNDSGAMTEWISEDNLQAYHRSTDYSSSENIDYSHMKRTRDQLKRYQNLFKKASSLANDSASSCVDSGISIACKSLPSHSKKQSKKPSATETSSSSSSGASDMTIIGYSYGRDSVPYKSKLPGKTVTLRQFKGLLSKKKGNFRYFFKRVSDDFGTGVVLEEVSDDQEVLPLWEGKIFCIIEAMDESPSLNEECI